MPGGKGVVALQGAPGRWAGALRWGIEGGERVVRWPPLVVLWLFLLQEDKAVNCSDQKLEYLCNETKHNLMVVSPEEKAYSSLAGGTIEGRVAFFGSSSTSSSHLEPTRFVY